MLGEREREGEREVKRERERGARDKQNRKHAIILFREHFVV